MPIREMPAFVFSHKHVRNAVIYALLASLALIVQGILMKSNAIALIFNIIIPYTAAITFGCHAITMAMDRPVMLLDSTIVYFGSLLVNQLISVEVGVRETYPVFTFLELIPFLFFSVAAATDKIKKTARRVLRISCVLILVCCLVIAVLAVFFNMKLFTERHYLKYTFSMISGFLGVFFMYLGMDELLIISGTQRRVRIPKKKKTAQS
ncbi:MAG: hypothetical protein IJK89_04290 [Clostridia bacterium]|nr:hypothetical protein [Clostridia bacterium]